ncbi:MAG TPA: BlaI/MecI/CopY family transcriptional regulator [Sphingomicrobium sp.]|nr:BlaI/MecI/CopY family transcriptional regulator [Sphingomicrobium sp.]
MEIENGHCNDQPGELWLPHEISLLLRREREVATIVYRLGSATATEVLDTLSKRISNAALRSMLNRLVAKGILKRILSGRAYVYLGALTSSESRDLALKQFADDHFYGSVFEAAETIASLLADR